jgi:hypothetical protein
MSFCSETIARFTCDPLFILAPEFPSPFRRSHIDSILEHRRVVLSAEIQVRDCREAESIAAI